MSEQILKFIIILQAPIYSRNNRNKLYSFNNALLLLLLLLQLSPLFLSLIYSSFRLHAFISSKPSIISRMCAAPTHPFPIFPIFPIFTISPIPLLLNNPACFVNSAFSVRISSIGSNDIGHYYSAAGAASNVRYICITVWCANERRVKCDRRPDHSRSNLIDLPTDERRGTSNELTASNVCYLRQISRSTVCCPLFVHVKCTNGLLCVLQLGHLRDTRTKFYHLFFGPITQIGLFKDFL